MSTLGQKLLPKTSLACLEAFLVNAWQGSSLLGPKALSFLPFPKHQSRSKTHRQGIPVRDRLRFHFCSSPRRLLPLANLTISRKPYSTPKKCDQQNTEKKMISFFSTTTTFLLSPHCTWFSLEVVMMTFWWCLLHSGHPRAGSKTPMPLAALTSPLLRPCSHRQQRQSQVRETGT